jgi:hypothetical protein
MTAPAGKQRNAAEVADIEAIKSGAIRLLSTRREAAPRG